MKISSHWLRDYIDHPLGSAELSHALTMCGLEVECELVQSAAVEGVRIGHILRVVHHPNAERLTLCQVDLGEGAPVQIVCGAPDVAAGLKVAVATAGTTLRPPGGPVRIRRSRIRGEVSTGMICAEDELGLTDDHSSILVLDPDAEPGEPFADYLCRAGASIQETILDIAITPNRPDATCHIGVARDISALCNVPLRKPGVKVPRAGGETAKRLKVSIECPEKCRRYAGMLVEGVTVGDSPLWLKQRLRAIGLRSANNVVDITNFVLHECGQPLHAFDFDKIADSTVIVREAFPGESLITLDGKTRALEPGTVLVCDGRRPVAIGGIMGGLNSEVTGSTTNVLIESAFFDPSSVRQSVRALGLGTDASYRFERGVDADGQAWAAARAAALMASLAGGTVVEGMADAHPNPIVAPTVTLRHARIARILGTSVAPAEVERILTALGFALTDTGSGSWQCRVPSYRPDVTKEIDLIEEVARINGLDSIPMPHATRLPGTVPESRPDDLLRAKVYGLLSGRGYREVYTNSLLSETDAVQFCLPALAAKGPVVKTANAVSRSMTTLRPSLLPGVLQVMSHNQNHGQEVLRFYEFGHVFHRVAEGAPYVPGFSEHAALIIAVSGPPGPPEWGAKTRQADIFDLKGDVETLLEALNVFGIRTEPSPESTPLMHNFAVIYSDDVEIGRIAALDEAVTAARDIRLPVFFAELNWSRLVRHAGVHTTRRYRPISRHPAVTRDISVVVDHTVSAGQMMDTIRATEQKLLQSVSVFDLYTGKEIGETKKSLAFSLRFGAQRTLRDVEVDTAIQVIIGALQTRHGAKLRGPATTHKVIP